MKLFGKLEKSKPSQVVVYELYHLDHELLQKIEIKVRAGGASDLETGISNDYKGLLSNLPRADASIDKIFGSNCEKNVLGLFGEDDTTTQELLEVETEKMNHERLSRKIACAKRLFDRGCYAKVAEAKTDCARDLVIATSATNWMYKCPKNIMQTNNTWRGTATYDLIHRFKKDLFLRMPLGYVDLEQGCYDENVT